LWSTKLDEDVEEDNSSNITSIVLKDIENEPVEESKKFLKLKKI
jgi:hypothetical protein